MRRRTLLVAVFLAALAGAVLGSTVTAGSNLLLKADARAVSASLAATVGTGDLNLRAARNANLTAQHVRIVGRDGDFELEHSTSSSASQLNAYYAGTGTRTPISIGEDDGQDVTSLIVGGKPGQTSDLQQWSLASSVALAVDGRGRLRFGDVTFWAAVQNGRVVLYGQPTGGKARVLAAG